MINFIKTFAQDFTADDTGLPQVTAQSGSVSSALAVIFGVAGALAVLLIIIGAIDFAGSEGDPEKISRGKKTIIYALIGLVICISAEAIILTVLNRL